MACVKKIQVEDTIYEAKTDFRTAIECNRIALDETIGDYERALGVICTIFDAKGLNNPSHYEKLLKWAKNWLSCGKEVEKSNEEPDMDFTQDYDYIVASFQSDYNIDLDETEMDWHRFMTLMNGLSNSELGNCCVLNRIRNLRNFDVSQIKDNNERQKIIKAKAQVALKQPQKDVKLTEEQQKSVDEFYKSLGF